MRLSKSSVAALTVLLASAAWLTAVHPAWAQDQPQPENASVSPEAISDALAAEIGLLCGGDRDCAEALGQLYSDFGIDQRVAAALSAPVVSDPSGSFAVGVDEATPLASDLSDPVADPTGGAVMAATGPILMPATGPGICALIPICQIELVQLAEDHDLPGLLLPAPPE